MRNPPKNHWSIYITVISLECEQLDTLFFGKPRGHSFLILVDENQKHVIRELHGTYHNRKLDRMGPNNGLTILNRLGVVASYLGLYRPFIKTLEYFKVRDNMIHLGVKEVKARLPYQEINGYKVTSGTQKDMQKIWEEAIKIGEDINNTSPPFIAFNRNNGGQNCHSAIHTILNAAGFTIDKNQLPDYILPGVDTLITKQSI